jgi:hypothetical protein
MHQRGHSATEPQPDADSSLRCAPLRRKSRHSRDPSPACGPKPFGGRRPEGFGPQGESGNPARSHVDPRPSTSSGQALRGGNEGLTFIPMGGPEAHDHSE